MLLADFLSFLDFIPSFMTEWWFLALGTVILIGLIVVYFVVRNKKTDED